MDIDYKTIDINIRPQSDKLLIEAFGPRREWASDLVEIPEALLDEKIYSFKGLMVKPEEDIGEQIGEVLLPNNVRQLYVAIRQQVFSKKNQALRLRLHFF